MHKDIQMTRKPRAGNTFKSFVRFLVSIKKYRGLIILSVILAMGSALLGIFIPKILGDITNIAIATYLQFLIMPKHIFLLLFPLNTLAIYVIK